MCTLTNTVCARVGSHVCMYTLLKYLCAPMRKESPDCLEHSTCLPFGAMLRHHHDSAVPLSNSDLPSCLHHHHHMHSCHISGPGKSRHREAWGPCSQTFPTIFSLLLELLSPFSSGQCMFHTDNHAALFTDKETSLERLENCCRFTWSTAVLLEL